MMDRPTVALCIPAFKAEQYLPCLLESARQQNPPFDEIIVCVDASPDATADVARNLGAVVIVNEKNLGCSASKNRALEAATADWIHFHDADDLLLPTFTRDAHDWIARTPDSDVILMGFDYVDFATGEVLGVGLHDDEQLQIDPIRYAISHKIPNFGVYRAEAIKACGGFDTDAGVLFNEDVAFHLKLACRGLKFRASSLITSRNFRHVNSMSGANQVKCLMAHHEVMRRMASTTGERYGDEIASRLWVAATGLAVYDEWGEADRALDLASRISEQLPTSHSRSFCFVCRLLGPKRALRLRELLIRWFKPHLRRAL